MSEVIPEYIGSRLSKIEEDSSNNPLSELKEDVGITEEIAQPEALKIPEKNKKSNKMVKKGIKKKKSGPKKLPLNPNAKSSVELPQLDIAPDSEEEISLEEATTEIEKSPAQVDMAASLKKIPSRKKKVVKPAPKKKTKKELPQVKVDQPKEDITQEKETNTESIVPKVTTQEARKTPTSIKEKPQSIKPTSPEKKSIRSANLSPEAERKAFVENIKRETQDFLQKLAEERKQRQKEYEIFRKKLRDDLAQN
ncbi:MAG: hypothetical protein AAFY41_03100 [Bacteroidota bacterium]